MNKKIALFPAIFLLCGCSHYGSHWLPMTLKSMNYDKSYKDSSWAPPGMELPSYGLEVRYTGPVTVTEFGNRSGPNYGFEIKGPGTVKYLGSPMPHEIENNKKNAERKMLNF